VTTKNKQQYRIRNWREYNKAFISRGSLTLWIDTRSTDTWLDHDWPARRGRRRTYTDAAIVCALLIREVYYLPLRSTQGLLSSLLHLMNRELPAPHYSKLSRRARHLSINLRPHAQQQIRHLVIDSTGLKLYGEGEWKVRLHGWAKHRTWRKLHLSIDGDSQLLTSALLTNKEIVAPRAVPHLLKQVTAPIEQVLADGAYDSRECYRAIAKRGARAVIPPWKGAVLWRDEYLKERNNNLRRVQRGGAAAWKKKVGYHTRSLVETAIYRLKQLFTDKLRSREGERQRTEVMLRCYVLNRMTSLGMPHSSPV
jgi:Transposase DDE domain